MNILEQLKSGVQTDSAQETQSIAHELTEEIPNNCTLALYGEMGTGKTTFVKGLAQAWGITQTITSPTFSIFNIYKGNRTLIHVDAYRLENELQAEALLLEEFLNPPYCLVIEWPEKMGASLPDDAYKIKFAAIKNNEHTIQII